MTNKMFERTTADGQVLMIVAAKKCRGLAFYVNDLLFYAEAYPSEMVDKLKTFYPDFLKEWQGSCTDWEKEWNNASNR
jgi:hypothetical protein